MSSFHGNLSESLYENVSNPSYEDQIKKHGLRISGLLSEDVDMIITCLHQKLPSVITDEKYEKLTRIACNKEKVDSLLVLIKFENDDAFNTFLEILYENGHKETLLLLTGKDWTPKTVPETPPPPRPQPGTYYIKKKFYIGQIIMWIFTILLRLQCCIK